MKRVFFPLSSSYHSDSEDLDLRAEASSSTVPASPKIVVDSDCTSQASGCPSHSSVDEDDDVPITDIYFVSIF